MKNINLKILTTTFLFLLANSAVLKSMPVDKQVSLAVGISFVAHDAEAKFAFSKDGSNLAYVESDGSISLYDLSTGALRAALPGDVNESIVSFAFSPDGETLASATKSAITLWDYVAGTQRTISSGQSESAKLFFSPDSMRLAGIDGQNRISVWNVASGTQQWILEAEADATLTSIAFSPDGDILASSYSNGRIKLWDMLTGQQLSISIETPAATAITDLVFNSKGLLAAVDTDERIFLFDPDSGYQQQNLEGLQEQVKAVAFSPNGEKLAAGSDPEAKIKLWDVSLTQQQSPAAGNSINNSVIKPLTVAIGLSFSVNDDMFASVGDDALIELWDVTSGELLQTLVGHLDHIAGFSFSSNRSTLASIGYDGQLLIWDLATGQELFTNQIITAGANIPSQQNGNTVSVTAVNTETPLASSNATDQILQADEVTKVAKKEKSKRKDKQLVSKPDPRDWKGVVSLSAEFTGQLHCSGHNEGIIRIWNDAGEKLAEFKGHNGKDVTGVTFYNKGKNVATVGRDSNILLWDIKKKKLIRTLQGPEHPVRAVAVSKKYIAAGGEETRIMLYDAKTGKLEDILSSRLLVDFVNTLAFSRDGKFLASGDAQGRILIWRMADMKVVQTLRGHFDEINTVTFGKKSDEIISGSRDKQVKVWDLRTGQQKLNITRHGQAIRSVKVSLNGKTLVSAGEGGEVFEWDLSTGEMKRNHTEDSADINTLEITANGRLLIGNEMGEIKDRSIDQVN